MSNKNKTDDKTQANSEGSQTDYKLDSMQGQSGIDIEAVVSEVMNLHGRSIIKISRDGFKKRGCGFVFINLRGHSAALVKHDGLPDEITAEYVTPGSRPVCAFQMDIPDYDPKKEVVFVIEFSEGLSIGTANIEDYDAERPRRAA